MRPVHVFERGACRVNILEDRDAEPEHRYVAVFTTANARDPIAYRASHLDDLAWAVQAASEAVGQLMLRDSLRYVPRDRVAVEHGPRAGAQRAA